MKKKQPSKTTVAKTPPEPRAWCVGDLVMKQGMQGVYEITYISPNGKEVNLCLPRTNFELFRVRVELITPAK